MATKYCEVEDVSAYLMVNIDESFETQVETWIGAMESYVERITHRIFVAPTEATSKYFNGNGKDYIFIDECTGIESVKVDGVEIDEDNYTLEPYNELPYYKIILTAGIFYKTAPKNVEVEAKWGFSETCPPEITQAVAILVGGIIKGNTTDLNFVKQVRIGEYSVSYDAASEKDYVSAMDILKRYTKIYV